MNKIKHKLNPNWVTGFIDAEGCFSVVLLKNKKYKAGWQVQSRFKIQLHIRDEGLLQEIKLFFNNAGRIWTKDKSVCYSVCSKNEIIKIIIPHFDKYPLITSKQRDFLLFKSILEIMDKNEHLNKEGLINIVSLRASLNKGLPTRLMDHFSYLNKMKKSEVIMPLNLDYNWFAGFFSGEGCFFIEISKLKAPRLINTVGLRVFVGQHIKDKLLINEFINTLGCGSVKYSTKNFAMYSVNNFKDIYYKIIPFFNQYKIEGEKLLDFKDFCIVAELINKKAHLTIEGLEQIKSIKSGMNLGRY